MPKIVKKVEPTNHSRYWMGRDVFDDDDADDAASDGLDLRRVVRLAAVRRAIANFVNILSGRNDLKVEFSSGKDSYTDGKRIVIAADDNPDHFDTMVGLALHEASHVLLTDFSLLRNIDQWMKSLPSAGNAMAYHADAYVKAGTVLTNILPPSLRGLLSPVPTLETRASQYYGDDILNGEEVISAPVWEELRDMYAHLHKLMNILEDRRIDKHVYTTASGYRPYYDALYAEYFFTAEMEANLRYNPAWRVPTVDAYLDRLLLMFHPAAKPDALPGLPALLSLVDLPTIDRLVPQKVSIHSAPMTTYDDMPPLFKEACTLYAYIRKFAIMAESKKAENAGGDPVPMPESLSDLPNLDLMPDSDDMVPCEPEEYTGRAKKALYDEKRTAKQKEKMEKVMDGKPPKKVAKKAEAEAAAAIEAAGGSIEEIGGDGKVPRSSCLVTRKLTDAIMNQDWFIFTSSWTSDNMINRRHQRVVLAGKRMGAILLQRLQVRNDPMLSMQTRLPSGKMDRRLLAQLGMDNVSVFQRSRVDTFRPALLHLSIDASGSMNGSKWDRTMTVAVALAYVGSKMANIETVVSIRGGRDGIPLVCVAYDSRTDDFERFARLVPKLSPNGATPEGLCFEATMGLILEATQSHDVYFVNFSDGEPSYHVAPISRGLTSANKNIAWTSCNYGGSVAESHTRKQVQIMREAGVKILSYFISEDGVSDYLLGSSRDAFRRMYGEDATYVNVSNATEVLRTLNKVLLRRGT